jgi:uncharacterized protein YdhG (YjbR/CyaY superfamily)
MAMTVDEFVATKVPSEFQPIVDVIRELMREYAPDVREAIGYGMPVYKQKKICLDQPEQEGHHLRFFTWH